MKKRFSDEQIISILCEAGAGVSARDTAEIRTGINEAFSGNMMLRGDLTHQAGNKGYSDSLAVAGLIISF